MSYTNLTYHAVFSTHYRKRTISEEHAESLYAYIIGIVNRNKGCVRAINGMTDHVHIVMDIPADTSVSDFIKKIKQGSSAWLYKNENFHGWEGWCSGYAAFTCSPQSLDGALQYVRNQKEHHKKASFEDELRKMLSYVGLTYNELDLM
ncbi:MAG: IS200/IS605 family transposase [Prevotellaceae bacterium]|nr:IS200/IS605 family transposase [Prevotellaceae bacterium]MCD8304410.1 IS200/IS605 family transposase [Prevotellaceae bacterium]